MDLRDYILQRRQELQQQAHARLIVLRANKTGAHERVCVHRETADGWIASATEGTDRRPALWLKGVWERIE